MYLKYTLRKGCEIMDGATIKAIRLYFGMSQADFAEKLGLSKSCIAHVETGRRAVSSNLRMRIAARLQLPDEFLTIVEQAKKIATI
jgi:antitoxin HigA-1